MQDVKRVLKSLVERGVLDSPQVTPEMISGLDSSCAYLKSIARGDEWVYFVAKLQGRRVLVIGGSNPDSRFKGEVVELNDRCMMQMVGLDAEAADGLRSVFAWTAPVAISSTPSTMGLGDRLGIASPGHIQLIRQYEARPVLAQQSSRELMLTDRTYREVVDCATVAVFQEGYREGFGADGDHLKNFEEVENVLDCGASMITFDSSEHISAEAAAMSTDRLKAAYAELPEALRRRYEARYLDRSFTVKGFADEQFTVHFNQEEVARNVLVYHKALAFTEQVYARLRKRVGSRPVDFEMSIDETTTPTTPAQHYFVANELAEAGVESTSLAPRFCGEFQKGIDYIGDIAQFEAEYKVHEAIARRFGYKLSIHSGSDKFSVFPIIGKYSEQKVHVKTAGTNWLEAVRAIARVAPDLYRRMHTMALNRFSEATKYYHVTTDLSKVPELSSLGDEQLPELMNRDEARQLMHITYGVLLTAEDDQGQRTIRKEVYDVLNDQEEAYAKALRDHIGRHADTLGFRKR